MLYVRPLSTASFFTTTRPNAFRISYPSSSFLHIKSIDCIRFSSRSVCSILPSRPTILSGKQSSPSSILSRPFTSSGKSLLRYRPASPPPRKAFLAFLESIPQDYVFKGILGANAIIFIMWYMSNEQRKTNGDPSALIWMHQNFTNSWQNLSSGRIWTPITSCFSHTDFSHILVNGFSFFFLAQPVLQMLGSRHFLLLYLGGGLIGCVTSMSWENGVNGRDRPALGASGAIYSIASLLACAAPTMKFYIYGILPVPAWLAVSGIFAYDMYSTLNKKQGTTDTVGHIGGLLAGVGYFIARRSRFI